MGPALFNDVPSKSVFGRGVQEGRGGTHQSMVSIHPKELDEWMMMGGGWMDGRVDGGTGCECEWMDEGTGQDRTGKFMETGHACVFLQKRELCRRHTTLANKETGSMQHADRQDDNGRGTAHGTNPTPNLEQKIHCVRRRNCTFK